jgi:predicted metal-dependent hydrolase
VNQALAHRYPKIAAHDKAARDYFARRGKTDSLKQLVGFTAGYETFTFLAGLVILDNYARWFADSDPVMKALWVWHQVEEVEHGAVAFDVYKSLFGEHEIYRKYMIVLALLHIAGETAKSYTHMARVEGWLRTPFKAAYHMMFGTMMLLRLFWSALPVFRRGYHPRQHPLVTSAQNPIQIAWRRFENDGGDVLEIDHAKMARIMDLITPSDRMVTA